MFDFDEDLIKITRYDVLGELPDPFEKDGGGRISGPAEWPSRRAEIYRTAVELQYGTQPPAPEVFKVDPLYISETASSYRITAGTHEKQVSFIMRVIARMGMKNPSAVIDGDLCFNYAFDQAYLRHFLDNNIAYVFFNRTELANDIRGEGRRKGQLYDVYPDYSFGALGAWAWGYSRCADALEWIGGFDLTWLAFTGHSRGGKTAMLAGVLDERAKIVNPNESNAGSCSCYRIHMSAIKEDGKEGRSETLADLYGRFGYWMGEGMGIYAENEADLPFDCHFLKAMVAPRVLLVGEAASDIWTNPVGSWQTSVAAKEVYRFLGCEDNLLWYFRKGVHFHHPADAMMLADVIMHFRDGIPLKGSYYRTPFKRPEPIFSWKSPSV